MDQVSKLTQEQLDHETQEQTEGNKFAKIMEKFVISQNEMQTYADVIDQYMKEFVISQHEMQKYALQIKQEAIVIYKMQLQQNQNQMLTSANYNCYYYYTYANKSEKFVISRNEMQTYANKIKIFMEKFVMFQNEMQTYADVMEHYLNEFLILQHEMQKYALQIKQEAILIYKMQLQQNQNQMLTSANYNCYYYYTYANKSEKFVISQNEMQTYANKIKIFMEKFLMFQNEMQTYKNVIEKYMKELAIFQYEMEKHALQIKQDAIVMQKMQIYQNEILTYANKIEKFVRYLNEMQTCANVMQKFLEKFLRFQYEMETNAFEIKQDAIGIQKVQIQHSNKVTKFVRSQNEKQTYVRKIFQFIEKFVISENEMQKLAIKQNEVQKDATVMEKCYNFCEQQVQPIAELISISQQILTQPIEQQIQTLNSVINKLEKNNNLSNIKKKYYKHQYQQLLYTKLKVQGQAKQIPYIKFFIEASNPELAFYVLKEQLQRDQNRELLFTRKQYSFGFDLIIGAFGLDQSCFKVKNTKLDYGLIAKDNQLLQHHLQEFKQQLSSSLYIPIEKIQILGVSKENLEIDFQITGKDMDCIQKVIKENPIPKEFLDKHCISKIEYLRYFDQAKKQGGTTLSFQDLNPTYNMSWDDYNEKEERGPPYHRYDYYFPRGCYGFGLNVEKYGDDQDWIEKDGNPNEWRILYHGTLNDYVNPIVKNNLLPGKKNAFAEDLCYNEFKSAVQVGDGIYFSDRIDVCLDYASYTQIGNKKFKVLFMSRVNPKKIRQSNRMKDINYFVINNSEDVRPYRILLYEEKNIVSQNEMQKLTNEMQEDSTIMQKCQNFCEKYVQPIAEQISIQQKIHAQPIQQQILTLNQEINKLDKNNKLTNNQKQYYKHQYQQQLFTKLKDQGEVKSIPHVKQNIVASNPDVLFYVLKESLLRDQNRELLQTSKEYSFGFDSIIGVYGQDQSCLKVRNTNLDYDKIVNDNQLLQQHILEFKQKLSNSLNVPIDQIEILGVSKGSFEINFQIEGKNKDEILQEIKSKPNAEQFLNEYCNGKIEYLQYFDKARTDAYNSVKVTGVTLSSDDFNPKHNMSWDGFHEKEQRGPPYHRYDYYFPRGCYGFGLNIRKYGDNQDWIQMNGNPNEWRIMYHGTQNFAVNAIVKNNLQLGQRQLHKDDDCIDEFGNKVKVGKGIYFSDKIEVCLDPFEKYAPYTSIGDKEFAVIFMTRVNPKKIRQSDQMKSKQYFVVNESQDVRPYRILLHEKKNQRFCSLQ